MSVNDQNFILSQHKSFTGSSSRFLHKVLKNKPLFYFSMFSYVTTRNVHENISCIKNWSVYIKFFFKFSIVTSLNFVNKRILKNIFLKNFKNLRIWKEIESIINANLISFSNFSTDKNYKFYFVYLSIFLFEVYLSELDLFIKKFIFIFDSSQNIYDSPIINNNLGSFVFFSYTFNPLKLEKYLKPFKCLNQLGLFRQKFFYFLFANLKNYSFYFFRRNIFFTKFLRYCFFGIVGSKDFVIFVKNKVLSFLRSSLHFEMEKVQIFLTRKDESSFLGFSINILELNSKKSVFFLNMRACKKYSSRILSRLNQWKNFTSKLFLRRITYELISQVSTVLNTKNINISLFKYPKFWTYLFQLECVRSLQFNKLITTLDKIGLVPASFDGKIKFYLFSRYENFCLDFYSKKMRVTFNKILQTFPYLVKKSVLPLDIYLNSVLLDTKYSLVFIKNGVNNFFRTLGGKRLIGPKIGRDIPLNLYSVKYKKRFFNNLYIQVRFPILYTLFKLKHLGFLHPFKKRSIGNIKYFNLNDKDIIKIFGSYAYFFLDWFRCVDNFFQVKYVIELLRHSCYLTLSRKHNKNKVWSYRVYTSDLINIRSFRYSKSYFPSKNSLHSLKKKFLLNFTSNFHLAFFLLNI